jgi:hypothetical protein
MGIADPVTEFWLPAPKCASVVQLDFGLGPDGEIGRHSGLDENLSTLMGNYRVNPVKFGEPPEA